MWPEVAPRRESTLGFSPEARDKEKEDHSSFFHQVIPPVTMSFLVTKELQFLGHKVLQLKAERPRPGADKLASKRGLAHLGGEGLAHPL